jgi:hypothetical protein
MMPSPPINSNPPRMTNRRQPPKKQQRKVDCEMYAETADDDNGERRDEGGEDAEDWRPQLRVAELENWMYLGLLCEEAREMEGEGKTYHCRRRCFFCCVVWGERAGLKSTA